MKTAPKQVCEDLILLIERFKRELLALSEQQGITRTQCLVLHAIDRHGEVAMGQVAGVMHCDASNVTGIVDRLVHMELITREESQRDRRTKTLRLTPKGQKIVNHFNDELPIRLGCDKLTAEEQTALSKIVQKIII